MFCPCNSYFLFGLLFQYIFMGKNGKSVDYYNIYRGEYILFNAQKLIVWNKSFILQSGLETLCLKSIYLPFWSINLIFEMESLSNALSSVPSTSVTFLNACNSSIKNLIETILYRWMERFTRRSPSKYQQFYHFAMYQNIVSTTTGNGCPLGKVSLSRTEAYSKRFRKEIKLRWCSNASNVCYKMKGFFSM